MIIVKLIGGLGNQLFQYAFGIALAEKHNAEIKFDVSAFERFHLHEGLVLEKLSLPVSKASKDDIQRFVKSGIVGKILKRIPNRLYGGQYYRERARNLFDKNIVLNEIGYFDGYWQHEDYFLSIKDRLSETIKPSKKMSPRANCYLKKIKASPVPVSLHVRRGDYVDHPEIGILPFSYYTSSIAELKATIGAEVGFKLFVFTDDVEWVEQNLNFSGEEAEIVQGNKTSVEDFWLMNQCRHHILANSSFSWWAAWLKREAGSFIFAPKDWRLDSPDLYKNLPKNWIYI